MVTVQIGNYSVQMYDTIDELPVVRFHKYQKYLLIDAGIGSDINAFDQRIEKVRRYLSVKKFEEADKELQNIRQCVWMIQNEISPKERAFAVLIKSIDGQEYGISEDEIDKIHDLLKNAPLKDMTDQMDSVKKKIDNELITYFPKIFNDSSVKEYFGILKRRTMAVLNNIIAGIDNPEGTPEVDKLTTELITYSHPKVFAGADSVEIQFDRQFENLCLALSEQLHVKPKEYTVLEFYNAFDFLQERAKQAEKGQKKPNTGR